MLRNKVNIEAEKGELVIQNANGDKAIIPTHLRAKVEQMIAEGCHGCIDRLVSTLPVVDSSPGAKRAAEGAVVSTDTKGGPKKGTTVFIATEAKPKPAFRILDDPGKIPPQLKHYQDEFWEINRVINSLKDNIQYAKSNAEISIIHDKITPLQAQQDELINKFETSKYNYFKKDDYFDRDGVALENKLKEYYPDAKIVRKGVYGEEFGGLLKDMKNAKDRGDELITVFVNHADNRTNKIFGRSEEEVYGKVAELGSNIYCANCQDETQPEVLKKVTYGVDAYYPDFIKSDDDSHRTWGGVNSSATKGKDINETIQKLLYTIHDNTGEDDYDATYTKGSPLFKKTEAIRPNRVVTEIDPLLLPPINQIAGNPRKFANGGFTGNGDPRKLAVQTEQRPANFINDPQTREEFINQVLNNWNDNETFPSIPYKNIKLGTKDNVFTDLQIDRKLDFTEDQDGAAYFVISGKGKAGEDYYDKIYEDDIWDKLLENKKIKEAPAYSIKSLREGKGKIKERLKKTMEYDNTKKFIFPNGEAINLSDYAYNEKLSVDENRANYLKQYDNNIKLLNDYDEYSAPSKNAAPHEAYKKYLKEPKKIGFKDRTYFGRRDFITPSMMEDIVKAAKKNNVDPMDLLVLNGMENRFALRDFEDAGELAAIERITPEALADVYPSFNSFLLKKGYAPKGFAVKTNFGIYLNPLAYQEIGEQKLKKYKSEYNRLYKSNSGSSEPFDAMAKILKKKGSVVNYNPGEKKGNYFYKGEGKYSKDRLQRYNEVKAILSKESDVMSLFNSIIKKYNNKPVKTMKDGGMVNSSFISNFAESITSRDIRLNEIANWYQSRLTGVPSNPMVVEALAREAQTGSNKFQNLSNLT